MEEFWSVCKTIVSPGTFNQMLRSATPVALAAMGGLLTEYAGIMNIGMDGMILMGAFAGVLGSYFLASAFLGVGAAVALGVLTGLFFALLVVRLRSDEFIIGCALNTFAMGSTAFFSRAIFGLSGTAGLAVASLPRLHLSVLERVPFLGQILNDHSIFVYLSWVLVFLMWVLIFRTPWGFWLRAAGERPETLRTAGISPERMKWIASILCGVLCGLAGAHLSLGYLSGTFTENMSNSRGYIAFACVIFAGAHPGKAFAAALMFGFFDALGYRLQGTMNAELTSMIPYVITIVMMVYVVMRSERRKRSAGRRLARMRQ